MTGEDRPMQRRPRVVIVGAGFGGLSAAKGLARAPVDITVVDRHNYHLFRPLRCRPETSPVRSGGCFAASRTPKSFWPRYRGSISFGARSSPKATASPS